jgi:hypothetical protein
MFGAFPRRMADIQVVLPDPLLRWMPVDNTFPVPNLGTLGSDGDLTVKGSAVTIDGSGILIPNTNQSWIRTESDSTDLEWSNNAITVALWLKRSGNPAGAYGNIVAKGSNKTSWAAPYTQFQLTIDVVGVTNRTSTAFRTSAVSSTPIYETSYPQRPTVNIWYHIASVYDGTDLKLYLDGVVVAQSTPAGLWGPQWSNHGPWFLGSNSALSGTQSEGCPGTYHDIRIYDEALSELQIRKLRSITPF